MSHQTSSNRPLSPHLQVYKMMFTMVISGTHRITGFVMYFGIVLLIAWLVAAAMSDFYFDLMQAFFNHWFGRFVLFGYTWSLIHHTIGGIRHFIWDACKGFSLQAVEWLAKASLASSVTLTLLVWIIAYGVKP